MTLSTGSASAHHSFAMFDKSKERWIDATVDQFQWTNPHTWIQVTSRGEGKAVRWSLEGGSPNILSRNGWRRSSLKPGEKVRVLFYPLRDGKPGGSFVEVHKTDGTVLYYHG
ncbi:DUF6152 family protein [Tsuneonella sp. HG222]